MNKKQIMLVVLVMSLVTNPVVAFFLVKAAKRGDLAEVVRLVQSGSDVNEAHFSRTALHEAAQRGDVLMVRYLLKRGAKVNVSEWDGITPLIEAIRGRHLEIVHLLVAQGIERVAFSDPVGEFEKLIQEKEREVRNLKETKNRIERGIRGW